MVALHRDDVFPASVKTARAALRAGVRRDALPFNWRLVGALAVNGALWIGLVAGVRALSG